MPLEGDYEPSPARWVREQVETYESSGGQRGNTLLDTGLPVIILTTRGNKSRKVRKTPLMRVEHEGEYALVASQGGAPTHPVWYHNLKADPEAVVLQTIALLGKIAHERGAGVLLVTHDSDAAQLADRGFTLRDGELHSDVSSDVAI